MAKVNPQSVDNFTLIYFIDQIEEKSNKIDKNPVKKSILATF